MSFFPQGKGNNYRDGRILTFSKKYNHLYNDGISEDRDSSNNIRSTITEGESSVNESGTESDVSVDSRQSTRTEEIPKRDFLKEYQVLNRGRTQAREYKVEEADGEDEEEEEEEEMESAKREEPLWEEGQGDNNRKNEFTQCGKLILTQPNPSRN